MPHISSSVTLDERELDVKTREKTMRETVIKVGRQFVFGKGKPRKRKRPWTAASDTCAHSAVYQGVCPVCQERPNIKDDVLAGC